MNIKFFCNFVGAVFVIVLEIKHAMSIVSALSRKDTPQQDIEKLVVSKIFRIFVSSPEILYAVM